MDWSNDSNALRQANMQLEMQNHEKEKRAAELLIANLELAFQNEEKEKRAAELIVANLELAFQNDEKEKRAAELLIANRELLFQNSEKEKRAAELIIANKELAFQNTEKESRAAELIIANEELAFQIEEKEKRITEIKEAEQQREFDGNNLQALINNTNDLMWSIDRNFKIITSNHAFDEMVGAMSGNRLEKGADVLTAGLGKQQLLRFRDYYERAFAGEAFTEIEYTDHPVKLWSEISYYPIYKDQDVIGTACFSRNITKQKIAESHLRLLESVITHANDAVLITDAAPIDEPGPRIVYVNEAFTKMTGYESSEVVGRTPRILQGERTDRVQLAGIRHALNRNESIEVEIVNYKKNGEEFWNNFTLVPVMDKDKRLTHCVSIQRDVTSRRLLAETTRKRLELLVEERTLELNEALRKEKDLVELKSRFVSIASHEFRTPLSTIGFAAESILNYFDKLTTEQIKTKLRKIEDQTSHMTNLLEDILTVGKSEAGKIKVNLVSLDLKEFIESLIEETSAVAKVKRKITFVYSCAPGKINADDKLLRNVFNNLLTNAIKFSPAESEIRVVISDDERGISIEVSDEGIGIEKKELTSIFESFQRGSNASTVPGSGLGLSILKKAVELLDGSIEVKSLVGKGSTFNVRIPKR
jgi:PAS domain S-box-containing protein